MERVLRRERWPNRELAHLATNDTLGLWHLTVRELASGIVFPCLVAERSCKGLRYFRCAPCGFASCRAEIGLGGCPFVPAFGKIPCGPGQLGR
jgi:hypothetical protein